jgi:hypothetical protein
VRKQLLQFTLSLAVGAWVASAADAPRVPVLLELFTSEGCSSCPPADRLLEALDQKQPIAGADLIVLSEHVDYWDGSWKDPFSSPKWTERQRQYVRRFGLQSSYTPQLVVDGQSELVGSIQGEAMQAIQNALAKQKVPLNLSAVSREGANIKLHLNIPAIQASAKEGADILIALADDRAQSQVARGENAGRALRHVAVVQALMSVGKVASGEGFSGDFSLPVKAKSGVSGGLRVVAFVQDRLTGRVLGATQQKVN